jgi:hypothetical protein
MESVILTLVPAVIAVIVAVAAFFVGVLVERIRWNKLIEDGIIDAPKKRRG